MEKSTLYIIYATLSATTLCCSSAQAYYGKELCKYPEFSCIKVKKSDTWEKRWPDERERDIVMRLNRTNQPMTDRSWILVPKNLASLDILDLSPFPAQTNTGGKNLVLVDLSKLAFGAYNSAGELVRWGPVSGGKSFCSDIQESCTTPPGSYFITVKKGGDCFSSVFPVDTKGGAPMPYCMFFYQGYALHGSPAVPGYNASHGCVRLYTEDAQWLNEEFTKIGTKVVVVGNDTKANL